jgi:glycosidase
MSDECVLTRHGLASGQSGSKRGVEEVGRGVVGRSRDLVARLPARIRGRRRRAPERVAEPHRLRRLEGWLDHLISLGCNGLLLGPVFSSSTHGYDTTDYFSIDPRLGDGDDFDRLVAACHRRGIRVLLDGVFNHAGRQFPPVAQALAEGPDSPAADWVSRLHTHEGVISADYFEGHDTLVTLNHRSPRVQQFVRDVMLHWLRRGIDGWRLDAAYAVPSSFWATVLPDVRAEFEQAVVRR